MKENSLNQKKINYKYIETERMGDAPFIGVLISACDCNFNCKNCFNQHVKKIPTKQITLCELIDIVKSNPFHKGVIFAGLEWSLQLDELVAAIEIAHRNNLLTMVYTGCDKNSDYVQYLINNTSVNYIKYGKYKEKLITANHIEEGVILASSNQHIWRREYVKNS
jgi:pyruvate-formate lyase-activating enzyme